MATDIEKLIEKLRADIRNFHRDLQKAAKVPEPQARRIKARHQGMNRNREYAVQHGD